MLKDQEVKKVNKKTILFLILGIIISGLIVMVTTTYDFSKPKSVYRVYLKGKSVGLIKSKKNKWEIPQQEKIEEKVEPIEAKEK